MATISTLEPYVAARIEELPNGGEVFWSETEEVYSGLVEALCDMLLLVGRPDLIVSQPLTINPNTPWQSMPSGFFCLTNLQGPASEVYKVRLQDLDYAQVAGPDWEQDIGDSITTWAPIGLNMFAVHPSVSVAQTVLATGIASPITSIWPFAASTPVNFQDNFFEALEKYAASYLRFKEASSEFKEGVGLYQEYLNNAKTMTRLQDRIDPWLFGGATGAQITANPNTKR